MLGLTAILGSSIGQYPQHGQLVLLVKRQNTFIEKVCSGNWRLAGIELGMCHLRLEAIFEASQIVAQPNATDS